MTLDLTCLERSCCWSKVNQQKRAVTPVTVTYLSVILYLNRATELGKGPINECWATLMNSISYKNISVRAKFVKCHKEVPKFKVNLSCELFLLRRRLSKEMKVEKVKFLSVDLNNTYSHFTM